MRRTMLIAVLATATVAWACGGHEDWGGPKGPPPPPVQPAPAWTAQVAEGTSTGPAMPDAGHAHPADDAGAPATTRRGGDAGPPLVPRVEAQLSGGKVPGFDEAITGMRPAMKACVEGKGEVDAVVEITGQLDPKGHVTRSDKTGGSQFGEGAVPCLMKVVEGAQFKKPTEGTPKVTWRVKMSKE